MKMKSLLVVCAVLMALFTTSVSWAAPMDGMGMGRGGGMGMGLGMQGPPQTLTAEQQADWKAWHDKNLALRKEYLGNLVKSGVLTQEQVDARIKAMEASYAFRAKNGFIAPGAMAGVKLTDEQKTEMKKLFEQRLAIRKEALAAYVKSGQITQAQADSQIQRMQDRFNYSLENGFAGRKGGRGMGRGQGMGPGGGMGGGPRF